MLKNVTNVCFYVLKNVTLWRFYVQKNVIISMKRLLYSELLNWKKGLARKPLILNGARQVGKTWLLRHFGEREYSSVAYVNCQRTESMSHIFSDFSVERIVRSLSAYTGVDIKVGETLIILDEIQDYPRALTALKYFYEDAPEYHIAVAGSLLGLSLHNGVSFPVGKVTTLNLYPMTFVEFLFAIGKSQLADALVAGDWQLINSLPELYTDALRQYYYVGGMPSVVNRYVSGDGLIVVRKEQKQILSDYTRDFSKHVLHHTAERIRMVWENVPNQLAKENRKFIYKEVKKGGRASEFDDAIGWLIDAGLAYKVTRIKEPRMPLRFYDEPSVFKLFMLDVGLLGAMMDTPASSMLIDNSSFVEYKGAFTEEFVLTQLQPFGMPIRYFSSNDSRIEVDFVLQTENGIVPVEVKAGENVRSRSLRVFCDKHPELHAVRFSMKQYAVQDWMTNVPLYAIDAWLKGLTQS